MDKLTKEQAGLLMKIMNDAAWDANVILQYLGLPETHDGADKHLEMKQLTLLNHLNNAAAVFGLKMVQVK